MPEGEPPTSGQTSVDADNKARKPAQSWAEELERLHQRLQRLDEGVDVRKTCLARGCQEDWEETRLWQALRGEWSRVALIKTELGWLSADAAARVDRRLRAAGEIIDAQIAGRATEAAIKLNQALHALQRAWWSRHWNRWAWPWPPPWCFWLAAGLLAALGATAWAIVDQEYFPRGDDFPLRDALLAAALWGFAGAVVNGLRTVHQRVQAQEFERERVAWYALSPVIGLAFGAIVCVLFLAGLLSTGQDLEPTTEEVGATVTQMVPRPAETLQVAARSGPELSAAVARPDGAAVLPSSAAGAAIPAQGQPANDEENQEPSNKRGVDPTPILVLALLAGFAQNSFIGGLQQIVKARFRGASEEEETPA